MANRERQKIKFDQLIPNSVRAEEPNGCAYYPWKGWNNQAGLPTRPIEDGFDPREDRVRKF